MAQTLEKILGKEETCRSCKNKMVCGEATYQGQKKLQWQNWDGKPHYKKDGDKFICNIPIEQSTEWGLKDQTLLLDGSDDMKKIDRIHELEGKVRARLIELDKNDPVPEKIGLYVKLLLEK